MKRKFTKLMAAFALLVGLTIPMGMWGQAPVNTVLWGETWTGGGNAQPSAYGFTGTTVYGNATLTYENSSTSTKLYNEALAGGTAPELLLAKSNSTWTITGIPSGSATGLTLSFKANYDRTVVSTTTEGVNVGTKTFSNNTVSYPISVTSSVSSFVLVFTNTSDSNVRIDDIQLVVTTAGGGPQLTSTTTTITAPENFNNDLYAGTSAGTLTASVTETNGGAAVSGATVTWSSTNTDVATVDENGTVTLVAVGTTNITATYAGNTTYAPSTGTYQLNVVDNTPFDGMIFTAGTDMGSTTSNGTPDEMTKGNVHIYGSDAAFATAEYRMYKSSTTTISTTDGSTITKIEFINASSNPATGFANQTGWTTNSNGGVWQGEATSVQFVASGAQVRATEIRVSVVANTNPFITVDDVEIAYNATSGSIMAEIGNYVAGTMTAQTEATWITDFSYDQADEIVEIDFTPAENTSPSARTATVTLTYTYGDNQTVSEDVTITQNGNPDLPGGVNNPYTVEQALVAIDDANGEILNGRYATGFVSNIETAYSTQFHNITFDIVDEIGDEVFLRAYRCGGSEAADVRVGDQVVVYGDLYYYEDGSLYEFAQNCELVSLTHAPSITVDPAIKEVPAMGGEYQHTVTLTNMTLVNQYAINIYYCNEDGEILQNQASLDWIEIGEITTSGIDYLVHENEEPEVRTAYFKLGATPTGGDIVYSNLVTVTQAAAEAPIAGGKYVKVTSDEDLTDGQYLIVYSTESLAFDGSLVKLDVTSNTIQVTYIGDDIKVTNETTNAEFSIDINAGTIMSASGFYIGRSSDSNGLEASLTDEFTNTISIDEDGNADVVAYGGAYLRYNATAGQDRFRYFKSSTYSSQKAIQLYKKVEATPAGPSITVTGYGDTEGGYVLLAWPESTSPANIEGMISDDYGAQLTPETPGTYDLYYYDESQEMEWRNYRTNSFNLVPGKGYLYASKEGVTLTYEGEANPDFEDVVNLPYTENDLVKSIYLAGNSKTNEQTFYVYNSELAKQTFNYLTMNEDGDGFISGQGAAYTAPAMTGFFVQAPGAGMTLSTENLEDVVNVSSLNINVLRDRGSVIDNAIVSFSNGSMMDKFYLKNNTTRVYIPQGNREMAIANSAAEAEMPVSFRASENGTYTLSIETENVEMNYLHLIDNMTGMDVDLLQTPNYTFEAKTSDYASRFRLVFSANGTTDNEAETFAYFNGSSWTVSNLGVATLQVVDVTGRTVSSEQINGNATISLNQTPGVYMLRLVNGNGVKVQKVVVK